MKIIFNIFKGKTTIPSLIKRQLLEHDVQVVIVKKRYLIYDFVYSSWKPGKIWIIPGIQEFYLLATRRSGMRHDEREGRLNESWTAWRRRRNSTTWSCRTRTRSRTCAREVNTIAFGWVTVRYSVDEDEDGEDADDVDEFDLEDDGDDEEKGFKSR